MKKEILILILFFLTFQGETIAQEKSNFYHNINPSIGLRYSGRIVEVGASYTLVKRIIRRNYLSAEVGLYNFFRIQNKKSYLSFGSSLGLIHNYARNNKLWLQVKYYNFELDDSSFELKLGHNLKLFSQWIYVYFGYSRAFDIESPPKLTSRGG